MAEQAKLARSCQRPGSKNLDVVRTSQDPEIGWSKGGAGEFASNPHLSVVCAYPAQPQEKRKQPGRYRAGGSKHITVPQASNIVEAVGFAKSISLPLVAHLTIHWACTVALDDLDGARFAKVREGLNKVLLRRGISSAHVWCRECKARTDIVHGHMLFHLPIKYRTGAKLDEIRVALDRLVDRHSGGIEHEMAVKLVIWPDPDGLYLLKGGGREVWRQFRISKKWRESQGIIHGKRCGTSQNLGPAARSRAAAQSTAEREAARPPRKEVA